MPNTTQNYGFKKPYYAENADVSVLNENFDALDEALMVTADQTAAPPQLNTRGKLGAAVSWIVNRIKAITGKANWWEAPATTLEACAAHISSGTHALATTVAAGFMSAADKLMLVGATNTNTAGKLMLRDAVGRAQAANPAAAQDIATKDYVDLSCVRLGTDSSMAAKITAQSNTAYATRQVHNIVFWTSGASPPATQNGDVIIKTF